MPDSVSRFSGENKTLLAGWSFSEAVGSLRPGETCTEFGHETFGFIAQRREAKTYDVPVLGTSLGDSCDMPDRCVFAGQRDAFDRMEVVRA